MEERIVKFYEVVRGHWSSAGNFIGETVDGDKIHIYKAQMEFFLNHPAFNAFTKDNGAFEEVQYPIFVLAYDKSFINSKGENVTRLTAGSVWRSYSALIEALLTDQSLQKYRSE